MVNDTPDFGKFIPKINLTLIPQNGSNVLYYKKQVSTELTMQVSENSPIKTPFYDPFIGAEFDAILDAYRVAEDYSVTGWDVLPDDMWRDWVEQQMAAGWF